MKNDDYILVIGGSNVDLTGCPHTKLILGDSNPGTLKISSGGVGRNIAENIAKLKFPVKLLSAVGNDHFGSLLRTECAAAGIDTSYLIESCDIPTSTYLCLMNEKNDMHAAVSDMDVIKCITPDVIKANLSLLTDASAVVIDNNISPETINAVKDCGCKQILFDAVSGKKLRRVVDTVRDIAAVKLNALEAEILSGLRVVSFMDAETAAKIIRKRNIEHVFITLGAGGAYYLSSHGSFFRKPYKLPVRNTTGAGDALLAGIARGGVDGLSGADLLEYGSACAAAAAASEKTVSDKINPENIKLIMKGDINDL